MDKLNLVKMMKKDYQGTFDNGLILLSIIIAFVLLMGVLGVISMHMATSVSVASYVIFVLFAYSFYLVDAVRNFSKDHEFLLSELTGIPAPYLILVIVLVTIATICLVK